jgi:hypothetical protein
MSRSGSRSPRRSRAPASPNPIRRVYPSVKGEIQVRHLKMLGLAVITAAAAMAFVGASSAMAESTALCEVNELECPEGSVYPAGTVVEAKLLTGTTSVLLGPNLKVEVECTGSTSAGKTTTGLANPLKGELTSLAFSGCTYGPLHSPACTVTVNQLGTLTLLKTGTNLGQAAVSGVLVTIVCGSVFKCVYKTESLPMHAKGTGPSGEKAELTATEAKLTEEEKLLGVGCPSEGFFDAKYEITKPATGYIAL